MQQEVHLLDLFELEGDIDDDAADGEDWATVFSGGNALKTVGPTADGPNQSIFTQGSKDIDDISKWHWGNGSAPDKDELITAYAAAYLHDGDLITYFGANRFATDGDAQIGFWFFKQKISLIPGTDDFSGVHSVGDVLVLSDFTNGGTIGNIGVYKWDVIGQKGNNPVFGPKFIAGGIPQPDQNNTHVFCLEGAPNDDLACATINSDPINPSWPTQFKGVTGNDAEIPFGGFFEGGINLTELVGGDTCFSSFMAETRSSQSITATLKDFVLDNFETCGINVVKDCFDTVLNEQPADFLYTSSWTATVTNNGAGSLPVGTVISVQDDNGTPNDDSDDPDPVTCTLTATVATGDSVAEANPHCVFSGTIETNTNEVTNTVEATATINGTTLVASSSDICPPAPVAPELQICKRCNTVLEVVEGSVVVGINFDGEVCNSGDIPLQMTVTENHLVDPLTLSNLDANGFLAVGECGTYSGSYFPNSSSADPLAAEFTDTVTASGDHPALTEPVEVTAEASCGLCAVEPACTAQGGEGGAGGGPF